MNLLNGLGRDLRYGLRFLTRSPGFSAIAILSLAVGIGANTAIFSIVNSLLLQPRAVANPEQLVEIYVGEERAPYEGTSYPSYLDFRERNGVFSGLAAYGIEQFTFTDTDAVEQVWGEVVSSNYFEVLGVHLQQGRPFSGPDDLTTPGPLAVVIGHALWQRRFAGDANIVGRTVSLNGRPVTIAGVAPPDYTGYFRGLSSDVWVPATTLPELQSSQGRARITSRGNRWLQLIGRLRPGVTIEDARTRFKALSLEMQADHPIEWKARQESGRIRELVATVVAEREGRVHPEMRDTAWAVVALVVVVVNLVLLIACMNLAGMLLARAVSRRKELAIRLAIGAGRWRLIRQLITESVLMSLIAGVAGVVLTIWLLQVLLASLPALPEGIRLAVDVRVDWRVLAYAAAFATVTGVLFGLVPALQSSRPDVAGILKNDAGGGTGGYSRSRGRRALVVLQVGFSLLLLIGAGLVLRSLDKVRPANLGFTSTSILVAPLKLDSQRYDRARSQEFYRQVTERVLAIPGVSAATLSEAVPGGFLGTSRRGIDSIEGYTPGPGESLEIESSIVGPRYFTNMNIPIVQGRDFDERDRDGAPCAAIVNEAFVRRYFSSGAALGKRLDKCEVEGVVRDDRFHSLHPSVKPFFALSVLQRHEGRMMLLVHSAGDPAALLKPVRAVVQSLEPRMPLADIQTLDATFDAFAYPFRVLGLIMAASGVMALLLAVIGIYGIVSYSVAQRTREVGIRVALGASRDGILRLVIRQGMSLVIWGLALGLGLSFALTRVLTSAAFEADLLFGISATDTLTFAAVTVLLALVALAACWVPARRAAGLNPLQALRYE